LTQRELAERARTAQSVVARIEGGQSSPSAETLSRLLAAAGFTYRADLFPQPLDDPVVEAYKRDIDRSLLHENLARSIDDRVRALTALSRLAQEARRAGRVAAKRQ
jgi:transcriptional regulator with XRE-family HTH domain